MTPFIHLTDVDGLRVRILVTSITSYKDSGQLLPGGTTVVFEENNTATAVSVRESLEEVDALVLEKFSE